MTPYYRPILKRAWKLSLKNKWLWILGFFAAFVGNGSVYEALVRSFNNMSEGRSIFFTLREYAQSGVIGMISWTKLKILWQADASAFGLGIFTLVVVLAILALMISFGIICQAALIRGFIDLDKNKKVEAKKCFRVGIDRFWPVLELNVITKVILLGILVMLGYFVSLISLSNPVSQQILYVASFVVFIVLGIIIYFLTIYGVAYAVLRKRSAFEALRHAWGLFKRNIVLNLEMGLLLFLINIAVAIGFVIVSFFALAPAVLLYFIFLMAGAKLGMLLMGLLALIIFLVLLVLVGSWYATFQLGAWAVLFEELEENGGKSKIRRIVEHLRKTKRISRSK
ncbi:MAG: hypothetical protein UT02_C0001G0011 [Parcubacteria group bacterium GW2011_GWC2_38_7]|nr:MAG: hypothetical protein UT02_C0001G0011 [Parcubacteria group bacterium GW2011_GWC2_38_7]